jgi:hypothetical protein
MTTYVPPRIQSRKPIEAPLVGVTSPLPISAAFRPVVYEPPRIDQRAKIEGALQVLSSGPPS